MSDAGTTTAAVDDVFAALSACERARFERDLAVTFGDEAERAAAYRAQGAAASGLERAVLGLQAGLYETLWSDETDALGTRGTAVAGPPRIRPWSPC